MMKWSLETLKEMVIKVTGEEVLNKKGLIYIQVF